MKKYAVLSMDIEDWYHLDYFSDKNVDKDKSMLDGFGEYLKILEEQDIKTTFFVLSELVDSLGPQLIEADKMGHEIACHGKTHKRPLMMNINDFQRELIESKSTLSNLLGKEVVGYRAPCYSIDDERHEIVKNIGFHYSSSMMNVDNHPLYGSLDLSNYEEKIPGVYCKDGFTEFSLSTKRMLGKTIAVSGGGWIRLFPWYCFMKPLIRSYVSKAEFYALYIHPFELSNEKMPFVKESSVLTNIRARKGLKFVPNKIIQLIKILKSEGYTFTTFKELHDLTNSD